MKWGCLKKIIGGTLIPEGLERFHTAGLDSGLNVY